MDFESNDAMMEYCKSTGRTYCAFSIQQSSKLLGTVVLELFTDIAPATCANFIKYIKDGYQARRARRGMPCASGETGTFAVPPFLGTGWSYAACRRIGVRCTHVPTACTRLVSGAGREEVCARFVPPSIPVLNRVALHRAACDAPASWLQPTPTGHAAAPNSAQWLGAGRGHSRRQRQGRPR